MAKRIFICLVCMLCFSCVSTGRLQRQDAELVEANSRNIGRVESTIGSLSDTIHDSRERLEIVGRAGARIREASERLDYLITEYELEVERILDEIDRLRAELEASQKGQVDSYNDTDTGKRSNSGVADIEAQD